jgi:eukaryotic-like serine/threonine-protein kinase
MGQVYLGVNEHLGKKAAIKILLPAHSMRMRAESRFLQEARAAAQIDDPNIVDILDASEFSDGRFYILMPFIEGCSLDVLCTRMGPLPLEVAAEILLQLCGGLDAAHRHGIVHRDIKPQNILIGPRQQRQYFTTIVDFGIAKLLDAEMVINVHTESKAMMGTPGYMAPEQARGVRDIDARVDVYAIGTVAYHMLTGRTPYLDETLYGLIEKQITNAPFPTPRELRPNVPPLWEQAILSSLVIDRNRRLPSVKEFAELIARGIPKGDQLVRMLVPQFASLVLQPEATPMAGAIGEGHPPQVPVHAAPTVGGQTMHPNRAGKAATFAFALAAASGIGSVATYAAMVESEEPDAMAVATAAGEPAPLRVAEKTVEPERKPATPPAAAPEKTTPEKATSPAIAAPAPAPAPAPVVPTPATTPRPAVPKATDPPVATAAPKSGAAPVAKQRPGVVVIRVKPWATVTINDQNVGYAPVRRELPAGQYRITLTQDERQEVVKLMVIPGKTATIERLW